MNEFIIRILEAIDRNDYEMSMEKEVNETVVRDLQTVTGCHDIIELLLDFLEQREDEVISLEMENEEMLIRLAERRGK